MATNIWRVAMLRHNMWNKAFAHYWSARRGRDIIRPYQVYELQTYIMRYKLR